MKECCVNCRYLFEMEDWTEYPKGQFFCKVCGLFANENFAMALYGDFADSMCEEFIPRRVDADNGLD